VKVYLGIDVGSVTTKLAVLDQRNELITHSYRPTEGDPIRTLQQGLRQVREYLPEDAEISGVATTGSARYLAGVIVGADLVKNEITCQAVAAINYIPEVQTVIEIGGQDSKIIIIRDGVVTDFGMNTVCAAGTGSFLNHQAERLNMSIKEFSQWALKSNAPASIAGRCTVFAESDMIHKQQMGHRAEDIVYGLCQTLVRNYLNDVSLGKNIAPPVVFQGGVAFNQGIVRTLQEELAIEIIIPPHPEIMGAIGAALLLDEELVRNKSSFKGFGVTEIEYHTASFECQACPYLCQIAKLAHNGQFLAHWGGRCNLWQKSSRSSLRESR